MDGENDASPELHGVWFQLSHTPGVLRRPCRYLHEIEHPVIEFTPDINTLVSRCNVII